MRRLEVIKSELIVMTCGCGTSKNDNMQAYMDVNLLRLKMEQKWKRKLKVVKVADCMTDLMSLSNVY